MQPGPELSGVAPHHCTHSCCEDSKHYRALFRSALGKVRGCSGGGAAELERNRRRVKSGGVRAGGGEGKEGGLSVGMNSLRLCGARFPRPPPGPFDK